MTKRGWLGVGVASAVGLAIAVGASAWFFGWVGGSSAPKSPGGTADSAAIGVDEWARRLGRGDAEALANFRDRVVQTAEQGKPLALSEAEARELITLCQGAALGFSRFGPMGRATLAGLAGGLLERLGAAPTPTNWVQALEPIHNVLSQALADADVQARTSALAATAKVWDWMPSRSALPIEETALGTWKDSFHQPVCRLLIAPEPQARAGAVLNLSRIPIDEMAAPAAVRVADVDPVVRRQTLVGFAHRSGVLSEDAVLPRLHDEDPSLVLLAQWVLTTRGLTDNQIELGRQVFHPVAEVRKAVLAQIEDRDDIDPIVWLLHLSRDPNEAVRAEALKSMGQRADTPQILKRLTEMAVEDPSGPIRAQARQLLPAEAAAVLPPVGRGETVAIPPLPGSSALNPKAN
jgi:hypothetical protein